MAPVEHYPFRFRDPRTGKWVRARYVATRSELESRYREWEILGPPDIRGDEPAQMFQPNLREIAETPLELQPSSRDAAANRRDRADPATSFFPAVCHLSPIWRAGSYGNGCRAQPHCSISARRDDRIPT